MSGARGEMVVVVFGADVVVGRVVDTGALTVVVGAVLALPLEHPHAKTINAVPATAPPRINTGAILPAGEAARTHQETSGIHSSGYVDGAKNHDSIA
jgi:hypothetical protein